MAECHPTEQQKRQDALDALYKQAGRDRKSHPHYSMYTGLYQEWIQQSQEAA